MLLIFAAMNRQVGKKILFIFFAFAVACFGIKTASPFPIRIIGDSISETLSDPSSQIPNSDLEGMHFQLAGGHIAVQKNLAQLHLSPTADLQTNVSLENLQIKESSLLIKDYLFHIYPSHNFW
jgi:hypothetical protein